MDDFISIALTALLVYFFFRNSMKPQKFPPGPPKLPIVGGLMSFNRKSLVHNIKDLVTEYGPICGVFFGSRKVVIIADYKMLKEVFLKDETSHRPPCQPINEFHPGWQKMSIENANRIPGLLGSGKKHWSEQRNFLVNNFKDSNIGNLNTENIIKEEVTKLCSILGRIEKDEAVNLTSGISPCILNILSILLVGEKMEFEDEKLLTLYKQFDKLSRNHFGLQVPMITALPHPSMSKWPLIRDLINLEAYDESLKTCQNFIKTHIDNHKQTIDPENARDLMDLMLIETKNTEDPKSSFFEEKGYNSMLNTLIDLFLIGFEPTSSNVMWFFLYMIHHPDVQEKVQEELDKIVGRNRSPSMDDKPNLNYLNAVLVESQRTASVLGSGFPHFTTKEMEVGDFIIPEDTIIYGSLYHVLNDPQTYDNPHLFNPDRFLDENGKFVPDERASAPYGLGTRVCPGQSLADASMFLFAAGILQQFKVECAKDKSVPSYDFDDSFPAGSLRRPPYFLVQLTHRFKL